MNMIQRSIDKIANALKRVDLFEPDLPDDCPLFVEGPDGSFRELLGNSEETGATFTERLTVGHLRNLLPQGAEKGWAEVWEKFDE